MKMETVSLSVSFRKKHSSFLGYFTTKDALEYLNPTGYIEGMMDWRKHQVTYLMSKMDSRARIGVDIKKTNITYSY